MIRTRVLAVLGFLLTLSVSLNAQWKDNMGGSWNNPTSASIGNIVNDSLWNRVFAKARARDKARAAAAANTGGVKTPEAKLPVSEPQVSKKTPAQIDAAVQFHSTGTQIDTQGIANELGGDDAQLRKDMATLVSTLLTEYEKAAKAQGKPNDIALATTAALVYNSSIYNGTQEPDDARIMEIRDALAELMAEGGTLAGMSDRQKQVLYEKLVISTLLAKAGYENSKEKGDKDAMASYRGLAGQTLTMVSGLAPEKVDFSNEAARRNTQLLLDSNAAPPSADLPNVPAAPASSAEYVNGDPFPDKPFRSPQEPLAGPVKQSITMADLAGDWSDSGGANVVTYVHSGTGSYAGSDATFSTGWYAIKSDGSFTQKFQGRTDNHSVREVSSGTFTLSGEYIIVSYTGGERRTTSKYQFVAYMTLPNGGAVLSLIYLGADGKPYTPEALIEVCGHAHAFITCGPGEVWVRKPAK